MIRCVSLVRSCVSCLAIAGLLVGCSSQDATPVAGSGSAGSSLASVAQPIIALTEVSDLPTCQRQNQSQVYYISSEDQLYYCDGTGLRELELASQPSWLTDTIAAPVTLCSSGGVVVRSGPDRDGDGQLSASEISASSPVCNGNDGATGATGSQGPAGETGAPGPAGPRGGVGTGGEEDPLPYAGQFVLDIDGISGTVALSSFAGCFDRFVGVLYQDCFFEVEGMPAPVLSWLAETVAGGDARHHLTVREVNNGAAQGGNRVVAQLEISSGWIRDFRISDFDVAAGGAGKLSFIVVPDLLTSASPVEENDPVNMASFGPGDFTLDIPDVDRTGIVALSGLHLRRDMLYGAGSDPRRAYFAPGVLLFDDLTLGVAQSRSQSTLDDLTGWVDQLDQSANDLRDGVLTITNGPRSVAEIHLQQLTPLTGLSLLGERRSLTLRVQSFDLVPAP